MIDCNLITLPYQYKLVILDAINTIEQKHNALRDAHTDLDKKYKLLESVHKKTESEYQILKKDLHIKTFQNTSSQDCTYQINILNQRHKKQLRENETVAKLKQIRDARDARLKLEGITGLECEKLKRRLHNEQ